MKAILVILLAFSLVSVGVGYNLPASSIQGNLNMTSHNVIGLATPTNDTDAATKAYADAVAIGGGLPTAGGIMTGQIDFGGFTAYNSTTPVNDTDLSTKKYIDDSISGIGNITLDHGFVYNLQGAGMFNPCAYGAVPGDGIDDAPYIEEARQAAIANGGGNILILGQFDINTSQASSEGTPYIPDNSTFFRPANNTNWIGIPGYSEIRVMDGYRTKWRGTTVIGDFDLDSYTHDWGVYGIKFDLNGQNNLEDELTSETYDNATIKGAAVHSDYCGNVTIEDCVIENVTGWNALYLGGYYYRADSTITKGGIVRNCVFRNLGNQIPGNDLDDFSAIYVSLPFSIVEGNRIYGSDMSELNECGIEIHATDTVCRNNIIYNMTNGIYSAMDTGDGYNIVISGNTIQARHRGIGIWGLGFRHHDVTISNNNVRLLADYYVAQDPIGIDHCQSNGLWQTTSWMGDTTYPSDNVVIISNRVECLNNSTETDKSICIAVNHANNTVIRSNSVKGATQSAIYYYIVSGDVATFDISGNTIDGWGSYNDSTSYCGVYSGIVGTCVYGSVTLNTMMYYDQPVRPENNICVWVTGPGAKKTSVKWNNVLGPVWFDVYSDGALNVGDSEIVEQRSETPPSVHGYGTYSVGSIVWHSDAAAGEPAFWVCTTAGHPGVWKSCNLSE